MRILRRTLGVLAAFALLGAVIGAQQASADYLVLSYGNGKVLRFGSDGSFKSVFADSAANVVSPTAIAKGADGKIYVGCFVNQISSYIVRLSASGAYEAHVGTSDYGWIGGLAFDQAGNLYISDNNAWWVNKLTPGGVQTILDSGAEMVPAPGGMAFDASGRLYVVCSTAAGKVLRWNANGSFDKKVLDNPNLVDIAIVDLGGGAQAIRCARSESENTGYYLGWDIEGGWTGPYVETSGQPTWVNSMLQIDVSNVFLVGATGIYKYTNTDQGWSGSVFIASGAGTLTQPYGMIQVPDEIGSANSLNYQGRLADSAGNPVADGQKTLTFAFFAAETGGTALWVSDPLAVTTKGGLFTTAIPGVPATALEAKDIWLQVTVNGETLSPRTYISSVPFAIKAQKAQ